MSGADLSRSLGITDTETPLCADIPNLSHRAIAGAAGSERSHLLQTLRVIFT